MFKTINDNHWIIAAIDYVMSWLITKVISKVNEKVIADFIYNEIYMHYDASQEIFTDDDKNLWRDVMQRYLKKIKTLHKNINSYHSYINDKMKRLNDIIDTMLEKMLFNKYTKLWNLYLD